MIRVYSFYLYTNGRKPADVARRRALETTAEAVRILYNEALAERLRLFRLRPDENEQDAQALAEILDSVPSERWDSLERALRIFRTTGKGLNWMQQKSPKPEQWGVALRGLAALRKDNPVFAALPYPVGAAAFQRVGDAWNAFVQRWQARCRGGDTVPPWDAGQPGFVRYGENQTITFACPNGTAWKYLPPVEPAKEPQEFPPRVKWKLGRTARRRANQREREGKPRFSWVPGSVSLGKGHHGPAQTPRQNTGFDLSLIFPALSGVMQQRLIFRTVKNRPVPAEAYTGEPTIYPTAGRDGFALATEFEVTKTPKGWCARVTVSDPEPDAMLQYMPEILLPDPRIKRGDVLVVRTDEEKEALKKVRAAAHEVLRKRLDALPSAMLTIDTKTRSVCASWGKTYVLPVPAAADRKTKYVPPLTRALARRETLHKPEDEAAKAAIERDPELSRGEKDRLIRRINARRSNAYRSDEQLAARYMWHEAQARKEGQILLVKELLLDVPDGVKRLVVYLAPIEPIVRHMPAWPDAEATALNPKTGKVATFLPNRQWRRTEKAKQVLGMSPAQLVSILTQQANTLGVVVEREKVQTDKPKREKKPRKKVAK